MEQSYFIWNGKSSKSLRYLVVEKVDISAPAQKNKVTELTNRDGSYIFTSRNPMKRPLFEDRFVSISMYFKYNSIQERTAKLSEVMNWLYSVNFTNKNVLRIMPDYKHLMFTDAKIERFEQVEQASMHVMHIIVQFRVNPFSEYEDRIVLSSEEMDFTDGTVYVEFTNNGFYTNDWIIRLLGGGNHISITGPGFIYLLIYGFTESFEMDFKAKKIYADGVEKAIIDTTFELPAGISNFEFGSDGEAIIQFDVRNKFLYSYNNYADLNRIVVTQPQDEEPQDEQQEENNENEVS